MIAEAVEHSFRAGTRHGPGSGSPYSGTSLERFLSPLLFEAVEGQMIAEAVEHSFRAGTRHGP